MGNQVIHHIEDLDPSDPFYMPLLRVFHPLGLVLRMKKVVRDATPILYSKHFLSNSSYFHSFLPRIVL